MHRSTRAGAGYSTLPSSSADPQNAARNRSMLENENDQMTERLGSQISALKSLTIDIGHEVRSQNKMLNEMDSDFDSSSGFLGSAMTRLKRIQRAGYGAVTWKLLAFAFVVFLVVYLVIKLK